ncbi:MAG TPA: class I SAM-dependent methyltransferase [Actinomycetota bacterium]|nr:class I SAM-dependent methyltransferase [Actinomycetota bacterium]
MDPVLLDAARAAPGFMPEDEGIALYEAAFASAEIGPFIEIGSYCGKSTIYLGAAARETGQVVYTIDHHRGSEENQPGEQYFDPRFVDAEGRVDTLPTFRATIEHAGLQETVVGIVGLSEIVASKWATPLGLVFIDGGHSAKAAHADYDGWTPHLLPEGLLAIHDVFPDPADGGRPPFEIYERALESGRFEDVSATGSLRVLRATRDDPPLRP